jgi:hypothetical protein
VPEGWSRELIWTFAMMPGGAVPMREFLDSQRKQQRRLEHLLVKMRAAARLGWERASKQRKFEPVTDVADVFEFRTEFVRVQLRVYFTMYRPSGAEATYLVALAATTQKVGTGKIPAALKDLLGRRLREWQREKLTVPLPDTRGLT